LLSPALSDIGGQHAASPGFCNREVPVEVEVRRSLYLLRFTPGHQRRQPVLDRLERRRAAFARSGLVTGCRAE
jgi:hypothetical protein